MYGTIFPSKIKFLPLLIFLLSSPSFGLTLAGQINASTVTVTGDVTVSSMTVSSITITSLSLQGARIALKGLVLQTILSSTTVDTSTTSITLIPIPSMSATIALLNAEDYVRISISGMLQSNGRFVNLSIERDSTDLGQGALVSTDNLTQTGVTITDSPGDTSQHIYSLTYCGDGTNIVSFTANPIAYLLLEEIAR